LREAVASEVEGGRWTDLSRLESPGLEILLEPQAGGVLPGAELPAGGRRLFRATLREAPDEVLVVVSSGRPLGRLPAQATCRYRGVLAELARGQRIGVCSGYLLACPNGGIEARLLLHEPEECLHRIELDGALEASRGA